MIIISIIKFGIGSFENKAIMFRRLYITFPSFLNLKDDKTIQYLHRYYTIIILDCKSIVIVQKKHSFWCVERRYVQLFSHI